LYRVMAILIEVHKGNCKFRAALGRMPASIGRNDQPGMLRCRSSGTHPEK
jgi:hypothetical protein